MVIQFLIQLESNETERNGTMQFYDGRQGEGGRIGGGGGGGGSRDLASI